LPVASTFLIVASTLVPDAPASLPDAPTLLSAPCARSLGATIFSTADSILSPDASSFSAVAAKVFCSGIQISVDAPTFSVDPPTLLFLATIFSMLAPGFSSRASRRLTAASQTTPLREGVWRVRLGKHVDAPFQSPRSPQNACRRHQSSARAQNDRSSTGEPRPVRDAFAIACGHAEDVRLARLSGRADRLTVIAFSESM
jgi:hypothetical protein